MASLTTIGRSLSQEAAKRDVVPFKIQNLSQDNLRKQGKEGWDN
jgi:hypothetical protein